METVLATCSCHTSAAIAPATLADSSDRAVCLRPDQLDTELRVSDRLRRFGQFGRRQHSASGKAGYFDGYTVAPTDGGVRVRCGTGTFTGWINGPLRLNNNELDDCMQVLSDAGLTVEAVPDQHGGSLIVSE
jgi:hypothetical protein